MRTYVSKMLVGAGAANIAATTDLNIHAAADGSISVFDWDKPTSSSITAGTKLVGVVKGGGANGQIIAGPFPAASMKVYKRSYAAGTMQQGTLTVSDVPGADSIGQSIVFQTIFHQNLSLVPNQIKSFMWTVDIEEADTTGSATDFAARIVAAYDAAMAERVADGGIKYVAAVSSAAVITFTAEAVGGSYNGIDRPEQLVFELSATAKVLRKSYPSDTEFKTYEDSFSQGASADKGTYTIVNQSEVPVMANGTSDHVKWMEDQHQGRLGYADRRMWNNTKKYQYQAVDGTSYDYLIIEANLPGEGDQQNLMNWPVGCVIAASGSTSGVLATDLEVVLGSGAVVTA